jgi:hypothetical protein
MLNKEQIENNKKKLLETSEKYDVLTSDLLKFLGDDLFTSPASTTLDMYGAYPGGLIEHVFTASKYAVKVNSILPENLQQPINSILKCTILSQIGKVFLFVPNESEWHRNKLGKMYEFNDELVSMRVGERSAYYCSLHGVKLNEEEYQTIVNSDKGDNDLQSKYHSTPLAQIVKQGFELAIFEQKHG